jgi:CRP-like cAMP-binding protein
LAEAGLFANAYHCDAVAETNARITVLPKKALLRRLEKDPNASLCVAALLAWQVRELRARLEVHSIRSAAGRVLAWLRLASAGDPPRVNVSRPWVEIAPELGLTHEAVYRALTKLEGSGEITRTKNTIELSGSSNA